eukprot:365980-Chlamydomonas_euryale.AAC.1
MNIVGFSLSLSSPFHPGRAGPPARLWRGRARCGAGLEPQISVRDKAERGTPCARLRGGSSTSHDAVRRFVAARKV